MQHVGISPGPSGVAVLELRREQRKNALCMVMRDELEAALAALARDEQVRVVVLAGGDGIFCAGYDLREAQETGGRSFRHRFREFFEACYLFPKPVVAAVDGPALAGGFDLALAADLVVASTRARFAHPEIAFGPVATTALRRFLAPAHVRALALLGTSLGAEEARALGLVHRVVPEGRARDEAVALAQALAANPLPALSLTKRALEADTRAWIDADEAALDAAFRAPAEALAGYVARRLG